jgi:selenocysteine lyase/cysteine desulfurase
MAATVLDVHAARARFSSLRDDGFVFLDAPGGSQVPDEVGDAIGAHAARRIREHRRLTRRATASRSCDGPRRRGPLPSCRPTT